MDTVLLVEDDLKFQRILLTRLGKYKDKFGILLANNGDEAIAVLGQKKVSMVVTDIQMPRMDGLALLAYMNDRYPDVPCAVMTAHATSEISERLSKDSLPLLQKPFQTADLARTILKALEPESLSGALKGISVGSFLQMIEMEEKTCLLEVSAPGGKKGFFYFIEGELYDAKHRDLKGEEAAYGLIALSGVSISFRDLPDEKITRRINSSPMGLIMEAMRRKDESHG